VLAHAVVLTPACPPQPAALLVVGALGSLLDHGCVLSLLQTLCTDLCAAFSLACACKSVMVVDVGWELAQSKRFAAFMSQFCSADRNGTLQCLDLVSTAMASMARVALSLQKNHPAQTGDTKPCYMLQKHRRYAWGQLAAIQQCSDIQRQF
jgi:hypothetical protein